jgi:hypothetical protein
MNKKILFLTIVAFGFFSFGIARADISCSYSPVKNPIYNQAKFNYSCTGLVDPEICGYDADAPCLFMSMALEGYDSFCSPVVPFASSFSFSDYLGSFTDIGIQPFLLISDTNTLDSDGCLFNENQGQIAMPSSQVPPSFDIVSGSGGILSLPSGFIINALADTSSLLVDFRSILIIVIAISAVFVLIEKIVSFVKERKLK